MNFKVNESATKLRGGYYTDPSIADFLTRWVMATRPKDILEPSCGDGIFFDAISRSNHKSVQSVLGLELEQGEAAKARQRIRKLNGVNTKVLSTDFLKWSLYHFAEGACFDAALGNPPFIRYQYLDQELQAYSQKIFEYFNLPFTKHTNAWVPFIISSIALLRPGGRLAMVIPAEILHVLHAQSLRTFLARQCSKVLLFDPEELWFENVLQGAVLLLAEKKATPQAKCKGIAIVPTTDRTFLSANPATYFDKAACVNGTTIEGKWMRALLTSRERSLLDGALEQPDVFRFDDIASVDVGIVTGANKFFLVPDSVVETYGLQKWAHPMFGRSEHARGVIYDARAHEENRLLGLPTNFLWFGDKPITSFPKRVQDYIREGEAQNLHTRYKCRIRSPWYDVPSVSASKVSLLKRCHHFPRLILNKQNAFTTDTAYRIRPLKVADTRLVFSVVNSLTALSAELEGRHYGGGVLELVPSEIERLIIPAPKSVSIQLRRLDDDIRSETKPEKLFNQQDQLLLTPIGFTKKDREAALSAWSRLRTRRHRAQSKPNGSS
jgi:adenine-specific DNA methylase